ncbi:helix-turn-helix domain-containing protein [Roseateles amylovorans]|uniref:Helix-turn-helix domain-containing protein n=1 Tax=Roseateles amylovorans TaxID=2978473 RepID=A0ABY6B997_9BURK|nr:helix-turn-helix transcriptional regulator [Roseateles amylovorans]UXH81047.1 helix-turn-helix domain-containing protein [Roseateles amylovorans]
MPQFIVRTSEQLAPLLQAFRKQAGLTQREVALRLGVTQQTYSALERNADTVGAGRLLKLLHILGVDFVLGDRTPASLQETPPDSDTPRW